MPEVRIESSARRDLKRLPREVVEWALEVVRELRENPFLGERLRLPAGLRGHLLLQAKEGDYRLIYCYLPSRDTVYIVAVGHRDEIYERFRRRIR